MGCSSSSQKQKKQSNLKIAKKETIKKEPKIVFLGDAHVGKSSIAQRYCSNTVDENYEVTIGAVYHRKQVQLQNNYQLTLHLWDTGGEERFKAMAPLYYRDADAAILVYDQTEAKTFDSINFWLQELDNKVKNEGLILGLAGNKCDKPEEEKLVSRQQAEQFAKNNNLIFFETSAITDEGISQLINTVAEEYYNKKIKPLLTQQ
ncbi:P-loop containing nucleoside triphosphate hydrolase [Pseudocohnilembus persalinus]|uniref:p-loop containing nucleoside triphosphate hydrolase n=1 Tax=Pseudocohnilembus persalinus TaxID=266149 RepID=A0A0V0QM66_PSEPJ|nr:P-loop containing nucleoside triphosphate hydrolase [Pseudocohnilembus persalinus]|eukprot:KRX03316.1 P-loop containing nucleoside triphosphate hydrolase [Pseudocohnilembus persalinus]